MMKREPIEIRVVLFGEFSLSRGERVLAEKDYRSQKMWTVLAYLILNRHRPVPQTELIEQFWDEEDGQNPTSALKTLIFRLRKLLLPLWNDEECQPIVSSWGAYQWNPEISCKVDADEFESLLRACEGEETPVSLQLENYRKAMGLYQGEFLPKNTQSTWHTMRSAYYHMQYNQAAYRFALLLESQEQYEEMTRVCTQALQRGTLEEHFYVCLIHSLLKQGNYAQAMQQYEKATDTLYHELGVAPSEELKALYQQIMSESMREEPDLAAILEDMRECKNTGAFFCEYGFFKEAYRLEARRAARNGTCVHIALLTVSAPGERTFALETQNYAMEQLRKALKNSLRQGDVVSQYSGRQFVVMLPSANYENSLMVCERIEKAFYQKCRRQIAQLRYTVRALELFNSEGVAL